MADQDPLIAAALRTLTLEDARAARDAEAALGSLTWGEGVSVITQERVQLFLWYELPTKWMTEDDDHRRVAAALARAFDLLGLPRYAALCRSDTTARVLDAYGRGAAEGKKAFFKAEAASGIRPPDIDELEWGGIMGATEADARSSTAEMLELAIVCGDLVPGARGSKSRTAELARAHLTTPRPDLGGRSLVEAILDERFDDWLRPHRSATRRSILEPVAAVVRRGAELPAGSDDPLPRVRWFLGKLAGGQPLTASGYLNRAFAQEAASRLGWYQHRPPRSEADFYDLYHLRELTQRVGLVRRSGRTLMLTAKGRAALDDAEVLWRAVARGLIPRDRFLDANGEIVLALLLSGEVNADEITATLSAVLREDGWRAVDTNEPPTDDEISFAWHQTTNLLRALGLLDSGGQLLVREYSLTPVGHAIALECLHHRATGPKSTFHP